MGVNIYQGDCLGVMRTMPNSSANCCVTSPPYFALRDYGCEGQIGLEETPDAYVAKMVDVFREVKRVLRADGTLWLNLGDSYAGGGNYRGVSTDTLTAKQGSNRASRGLSQRCGVVDIPPGLKSKDLIGIPWRVAFALQADGWYLRQDIIWHKPNPMPESVTDRCTKSHEYIFLLSKSPRYYFDHEAIKEPAIHAGRNVKATGNAAKNANAGFGSDTKAGFTRHDTLCKETRNKRDVWTVATKPFKGAHFATFPLDLVEPCILAGCPAGGTVLDPFSGAGTTGIACVKHGRGYVGCELNPEYLQISLKRIADEESKYATF